MSKKRTHGSRWRRSIDMLPTSVRSTTGHWGSGNPAFTISRRRCGAASYMSSDTLRFTDMLLSPRPFGFRLVVHLEVICLELRPPPGAIHSMRDTAHTFEVSGSPVPILRKVQALDVHFVSPAPVPPGSATLQPGSRSHAGAWRSQGKLWRTGSGFMKQTSRYHTDPYPLLAGKPASLRHGALSPL